MMTLQSSNALRLVLSVMLAQPILRRDAMRIGLAGCTAEWLSLVCRTAEPCHNFRQILAVHPHRDATWHDAAAVAALVRPPLGVSRAMLAAGAERAGIRWSLPLVVHRCGRHPVIALAVGVWRICAAQDGCITASVTGKHAVQLLMAALASEVLAVMARDLRIAREGLPAVPSAEEAALLLAEALACMRSTSIGDRARRIACIAAGAMTRVDCH